MSAAPAVKSGTKNTERLMKVLLAPVISEKGTYVGEKNNQYLFRVMPDATKPEIKAAVELMFGTKDKKIEVLSVQMESIVSDLIAKCYFGRAGSPEERPLHATASADTTLV